MAWYEALALLLGGTVGLLLLGLPVAFAFFLPISLAHTFLCEAVLA